MSQQNQQQRPKNVLDDPKFKLNAPALPNGQDRPSLQPGYAKNNPYLMVRTGVPNDKDHGRIRAGLDTVAFYRVLEMIEEACAAPDGTNFYMENKNKPFINGARSKDLLVETKIIVGKDKEGRVFISVLSYDTARPKIIFHFGQQYYHQVVEKDGTPVSEAHASVVTARAWVRAIRDVFGAVASANYVHRTMDQNGGGNNNRGANGGGGYNGGGNRGGGGGYQRQNDSEFGGGDDLPF